VWLAAWTGVAGAQPPAAPSPSIPALPAVFEPGATSPSVTPWPCSSLFDFSFRLEAPTGKHGFLTVDGDGRFRFTDGTPARFWGVNVARDGVFAEHEVIDRVVTVFARSGVNLVRFHHLDGPGGIVGQGGGLDADRIAALDYWVARLGQRGIYVYLDLLDYRVFSEPGVERGIDLGRGAKPYAVFVPELIALQKEYAGRLLREHVNPHTNLPYADDPTVAFIELYDENGLFIRRNDIPTLREPYRERLKQRWNEWLRAKYSDSDRLRLGWAAGGATSDLLPFERVEKGTVALPILVPRSGDATSTARRQGPRRRADGARFFYEIHVEYFAQMRDHLRSLGVKVPIGAVGSSEQLADTRSITDVLDYVGANFYWDHPAWLSGREWQDPYFVNEEAPLRADGGRSLGPALAVALTAKKPLVVREWTYCWPNPARSTGVLEMAAFCSLQEIDAALAFTYQAANGGQPIDFFDFRADPARWGAFAVAGEAFVGRHVRPGALRVDVAFGPDDVFSSSQGLHPVHRAAWVSRLRNRFDDGQVSATADLTVLAGRSPGRGADGRDLILPGSASDDAGPPAMESEMAALSGYTVPPGRPPGDGSRQPVLFDGLIADGRRAEYDLTRTFDLDALAQAGFAPIGTNGSLRSALGFRDDAKGNFVFRNLPDRDVAALVLDVLGRRAQRLGATDRVVSHRSLEDGVTVSDTGEIVRDARQGLLTVAAPTARMVAASDASTLSAKAGDLELRTRDRCCALVAVALDGKPLFESRSYVVRMVTVAENRKQQVTGATGGPKPRLVMRRGEAPPTTLGQPSEAPATLSLGGYPLLRVRQRNGSWELVRIGDRFWFMTDTEGITASVAGGAAVPCPAHQPMVFDDRGVAVPPTA